MIIVQILAIVAEEAPREDDDFPEAPWAGEQEPDAEQAEAPQKPRRPTPSQGQPSDRSPAGIRAAPTWRPSKADRATVSASS